MKHLLYWIKFDPHCMHLALPSKCNTHVKGIQLFS